MRSGDANRRIVGGRREAGFALPVLLVALAVAAIAATRAEVGAGYRAAREREAELHYRAQAYVTAIRSFYMAEEKPLRRRLPTSLDELEKDPRFPLKRHIRRLYDDPLLRKPTPFRTIAGTPGPSLPQGIIGVASSTDVKLFRRANFKSNSGPTLGVENANELTFEVDLAELAAASRPPSVSPPPVTRPPNSDSQSKGVPADARPR